MLLSSQFTSISFHTKIKEERMKALSSFCQPFNCCTSTTISNRSSPTPITTIKNRLSSSLTDLFKFQDSNGHNTTNKEEEEQEDSLIDAAASFSHSPYHRHQPPRSTIIGTIYGRRRGRVTFSVQSDPSVPPPFLFELSVLTHQLAKEMNSGLLRIALECSKASSSQCAGHDQRYGSKRSGSLTPRIWKAYCNGRKVGYAVRRKPSGRDVMILDTMKSVTAGAGVLHFDDGLSINQELGDMLYMRASYERVVGSRDSVSYHLINPGGSPDAQELSVFLLRTS